MRIHVTFLQMYIPYLLTGFVVVIIYSFFRTVDLIWLDVIVVVVVVVVSGVDFPLATVPSTYIRLNYYIRTFFFYTGFNFKTDITYV